MQSHQSKKIGMAAARWTHTVAIKRTALRRWQCVGAAVIACSLLPAIASAQEAPAYTNAPVVVYAGPGAEYPQVASLQGGSPLSVMGCVPNYAWCDVAMPGLRGWIYGGSINYAYQGGAVPLMQYGPTIGLPIVGFSIGTYWGNYYRGRPWYHERDRWERRPPPPGYGPGGYGPGWHGGPGGEPHREQNWQRGPGGPGFHGGGPGPGPRPEGPGGRGPGGGGHGPEGRGPGGGGHGPEGHGPGGGGGHGPQGHPEGGHGGGPGPGGDHGPQH